MQLSKQEHMLAIARLSTFSLMSIGLLSLKKTLYADQNTTILSQASTHCCPV